MPSQRRYVANGSQATISVSGLPARQLVGQSVWVGPLRIGIVDDVVLGADIAIVLGVIVATTAGRHCFLPWIAARVRSDGSVEGAGTTMLLAEAELEYYLRSGTRLSRVLGLVVADDREGDAVVGDVLIGPGGQVEGFVVSDGPRTRPIALADTRVRWSEGQLLELSVTEPGRPEPTRSLRSAV